MNTLDLASKKVNLKKASSTHGGEYWGPCPECGGNDRFHVWPHQNEGKGGYWCRGCGKAGDNIQFLIDFDGMDFKGACAYLNIHVPDRGADYHPPSTIHNPQFQPATHQGPAKIWQEKAEKFLAWSQDCLKKNKSAIDWLAARGINVAAAEAARLGWNPGENGKDIFRARKAWGLPELLKDNGKPRMLWIPQGMVIPYIIDGVIQRLRIRRQEGEPRYYVVPGSSMSTMVIGTDRRAFVIVESELDGIACASACDLAGSVSLGTLQGKPDSAAYAVLKKAVQILNALDYGDQGGGKKAAERAMEWWSANFNDGCDRWPTPKGKDPGEAFAMGIDLEQWIKAGLPPVVTIGNEKKVQGSGFKVQGKETKQDVIPATAVIQEKQINQPPEDTAPLLAELWTLLRNNPGVKIINNAHHFTALRNGKYTSGRINRLLSEPVVFNHILNHPDEEIDWRNLIKA